MGVWEHGGKGIIHAKMKYSLRITITSTKGVGK
jgi:hypothetical protein